MDFSDFRVVHAYPVKKYMFRALQYIILLVTIVMLGFYVTVYQPELVNNLLISIDVFGLSKVAQNEHERIENIRKLTIPYEEKQVLMNRTVFMQATPEMVKLALGDPKKSIPTVWQGHNVVYYEYYLADDKRPTILVFVDEKLTQAYKGSAFSLETAK